MYANITQSEFIDTFKQSELRKDQFSYHGLIALYNYFIVWEASMQEDLEFDMVAICCEYSQLNIDEFNEQYDNEDPEDHIVCWVNNDEFIIQNF